MGNTLPVSLTTYKDVEVPVKEGKAPYKRKEAVGTEETLESFIKIFIERFNKYADHEVTAWYLRNAKHAVFHEDYLPKNSLKIISDFAQNIVLIQRHELSVQYFYRQQSTMHGSVVGVGRESPASEARNITIITVSEDKTKDSAWVGACLDLTLPRALQWASEKGSDIETVIHKTDRAGNEYWNSNMVEQHRQIAIKYQVNIIHFTEQACHNKDEADGEFARIKDKINQHRIRRTVELKDSKDVVEFGNQYLAKPGPRAKIEARKFYELSREQVKERKETVGKVRTLTHSSSKISTQYQIIISKNGEVRWRKLPCFCQQCLDFKFESCIFKNITGPLQLIVKAGQNLQI
jgi:hypothetical protein